MAAISSLKTALGGIGRNPVLFLGGLALGLVTLPQHVTQLAGIPLVPTALQVVTFFVTPFVAAGLYGMADEAVESRESKTAFGTLTSVGREKYVPLLLANIVEFGIVVAFGIVFAIVGIVLAFSVGIGSVAGGGNAAIGGGLLVGLAVLAVLALLYLLVTFLIQFFPVAVVVGDAGAIEAFTESYRLVRANLVPALGYSVIRFVVGVVVAAPVSGFLFWRSFQNFQDFQSAAGGAGAATPANVPTGLGLSTPEVVALAAISLATQMLLSTFAYTYAVSFYEAHDGGHAAPTGPDIDGDDVVPRFE